MEKENIKGSLPSLDNISQSSMLVRPCQLIPCSTEHQRNEAGLVGRKETFPV